MRKFAIGIGIGAVGLVASLSAALPAAAAPRPARPDLAKLGTEYGTYELSGAAQQAKDFGGKAGAPYDPCYHLACDTIKNFDWTGLDQLADGAAYATQKFAHSTLVVNGVRARTLRKAAGFNWRGGKLVR